MRVLLLGDSIRMAYAPLVRRALSDFAEVVDPPDNGGDSANVLRHLLRWLSDAEPVELVHLNCGLHDIKRAYGSDVRQVSLDDYADNVRSIFRLLADPSSARVVWATSTPVLDDRHHTTKGFDRFNEDVLAYNALSVRLAGEAHVPVNDLYGVIAANDPATCLGPDGVHMTERGNKLRCLPHSGRALPIVGVPSVSVEMLLPSVLESSLRFYMEEWTHG